MEQQLINELIRMINKMGGEAVMHELIDQADLNGSPKTWTPDEIRSALNFTRWQNSYFGKADAIAVIGILMDKYKLTVEEFDFC